ncbi:hypothetical protein [Parasitella parasitica]|uniref:Uncharacterized protein n=1 Tax=Parasitella parasitica TaxID=35722 RepID=A0A0B7NFY3_9FUNG|nr:hypothetical protein [Parasitella parasitica]
MRYLEKQIEWKAEKNKPRVHALTVINRVTEQILISLSTIFKKKKFSGKDDNTTKQAEKNGRLDTGASLSKSGSVICSSCGTPGHSSARSAECPNKKPLKDNIIKAAYGREYEVYTRKVYLKSILRKEYTSFTQRVRAQIFINHLTVENKDRLDYDHTKEQNFWYSVCRLVMEEKVTNKNYLDNFVVLAFDGFKSTFPSITYSRKDTKVKGHSDSLSAACITIATTYLNHIVEKFKKRFFYYMYIRLGEVYTNCQKAEIYNLIHEFVRELMIDGEPK